MTARTRQFSAAPYAKLARRAMIVGWLIGDSSCGRVGVNTRDETAGAVADSGAQPAVPDGGVVPDAGSDAGTDAATEVDAGGAAAMAGVGGANGGAGEPAGTHAGGTDSNGGAGGAESTGGVAAASGGAGGVVAEACDLSGTWAAKLELDVTWPGPVLAAGTDVAAFWGRFEMVQSENSVQVTLATCGVRLPDFALNPGVADEVYGLQFPTTLFDHEPPYLPSASSQASLDGSMPGSTLNIADQAVVLGATLPTPATDAWPSVAAVVAADHDQDSKPGVTASFASGSPVYSYPRADATGSARADRAYFAARLRFGGSVTLSTCDAASGTATVTSLDTHVVGCRIAGAGADCEPAQRDFIDAARPQYMTSSGNLVLARVQSGAACDRARAALP